MIEKGNSYRWVGMDTYKDEPGTWVAVSRQVLMPQNGTSFEVRYFEVAPGGYTSFEKHAHEHCVIVVRGKGKVRLGNDWSEIDLRDTVHVPPMTPHQFAAAGDEPLGFVCIVDKNRDRPVLLDPEGLPRTS